MEFKIDIDELDRHILQVLNDAACYLKFDYFIIGATARDFIFYNLHGVKIPRATTDIDIAIAVKSWDQFYNLKKYLISKDFKYCSMQHRVIFNNKPVDIIPFGMAKNNFISWPPEHAVFLNVSGFDESLNNIINIQDHGVNIPVIDTHGLLVLKLLSWSEDKEGRGKDAYDIGYILDFYYKLCDPVDLKTTYADLLETEPFHIELIWVRILGRIISKCYSKEIRKKVTLILEGELGMSVKSMLLNQMLTDSKIEMKSDKYELLLRNLLSGICD